MPDINASEDREIYSLTRVFIHGDSQAVQIPDAFRLETDRVQIYRNEKGELVLHPIALSRREALLDALRGFDEDFIFSTRLSERSFVPLAYPSDLSATLEKAAEG